jgi:hypothetical protein
MNMTALERALTDLGPHIDYPDTPDLALSVVAELRAKPVPELKKTWVLRSRPVLAVAATLIALGSVVLGLSPDAREAVADFLGIGGVRVEVVERPDEAPQTPPGDDIFLGDPVSQPEAQAELDFQILVPAAPGFRVPDAIYLDRSISSGMVSLVYRERPGFPAADGTGVAVLINEFLGASREDLMKKLAGPGAPLEFVDVGGDLAYWIEGPHTINVLDANGEIFEDRARVAGNTLLFQRDAVTVRIEGPLTLDQATAIAESLEATGT